MSKYKFIIPVEYENNDYLEIREKEIDLFSINNNKIRLISNNSKNICDSDGIKIECGIFNDLDECIEIAKKVYTNFLIALNDSCISYNMKNSNGNFVNFCKDEDAELYNEITIIDLDSKDNELKISLRTGPTGCTHFVFDKLYDINLDEKLKASLILNNYRKYLYLIDLFPYLDNTLASASLEVLLENETRTKGELEVIEEVCNYLNLRYDNTKNENYKIIKKMIENNKHKSISSRKQDLIKKYSNKKDLDKNLKRNEEISKNRTGEIHTCRKQDAKTVSVWPFINEVQFKYAKSINN